MTPRARRIVLRSALVFVALLILVPTGVLTYLAYKPLRLSPLWTETIERTPERIERGRYLAWHVALCIECHSDRDFTRWSAPPIRGTIGAGGEHFGHALGFPGEVVVANITGDPVAGVGRWTDGDLVRSIREGATPDGEALAPIMPFYYFNEMSDDDVRALVAYMRTLPPIATGPRPARHVDFPISVLLRSAPHPAGRNGHVPAVSPSDPVAYGRYLTTLGSCVWCHSPQHWGRVIAGREYSGGMEFTLPGGGHVRSSNLTPDATGLGPMSEATFIAMFRVRRQTDGRYDVDRPPPGTPPLAHNTVMPWALFSGMTDDDLHAIYSYLRTVRPIENRVQVFDIAIP